MRRLLARIAERLDDPPPPETHDEERCAYDLLWWNEWIEMWATVGLHAAVAELARRSCT